MKARVKLDYKKLGQIKADTIDALVKTADAVKTDLVESQTLPFDTGNMQNRKTFVDTKNKNKGIASVVIEGPYSRRLHFHPEFNFQQTKNAYAGGLWFQPYIDGIKKAFAKNAFKRFMRSKYK